jgi:hypothetical protein
MTEYGTDSAIFYYSSQKNTWDAMINEIYRLCPTAYVYIYAGHKVNVEYETQNKI